MVVKLYILPITYTGGATSIKRGSACSNTFAFWHTDSKDVAKRLRSNWNAIAKFFIDKRRYIEYYFYAAPAVSRFFGGNTIPCGNDVGKIFKCANNLVGRRFFVERVYRGFSVWPKGHCCGWRYPVFKRNRFFKKWVSLGIYTCFIIHQFNFEFFALLPDDYCVHCQSILSARGFYVGCGDFKSG